MMKHIAAGVALAAAALAAGAQGFPERGVGKVCAERSENNLLVEMCVSPGAFDDRADRETWLCPVITDGRDSLWLRPVIVAGRTRYYQHLRADGRNPGYDMLRSGKGDDYSYSAVVPYREWMENSTLELVSRTSGCCGEAESSPVARQMAALDFREKVYVPALVYVVPEQEEVKAREVHGSAYIDFRVNSSAIDPDYRRNARELEKIRSTIDAVRNDGDVSVTSLSIKGFASPEGPYENNVRLARSRTQALSDYVRELCSFPDEVMQVSWEAEDWDGLARWVREHDMDGKDAVLGIVTDIGTEPDRREYLLKTRFPEQYAVLYEKVYPALRHSDYVVSYTVCRYTDVSQIAAVMATGPQKLSLSELFMLSQSLDKESPEFREVMEVAVRMFPESEVANLNAAVTAVAYKDYAKARQYLGRAGDSPEAAYTAGILEACEGRYDEALDLLGEAGRAGVEEAYGEIVKLRELGYAE